MNKKTDAEKVIKGLKQCIICGIAEDKCAECPYIQDTSCIITLKRDALKLLEEQQAKIDELIKEASGYAELLIKYGIIKDGEQE